MANDAFIEASQLFVNISQRKYQQLLNQGKIRPVADEAGKSGLLCKNTTRCSDFSLILALLN